MGLWGRATTCGSRKRMKRICGTVYVPIDAFFCIQWELGEYNKVEASIYETNQ